MMAPRIDLRSVFRSEFSADAAELSLSERVCDWAVWGFASWTVVCHGVVWFGGGLWLLLWAAFAVMLLGVVAIRFLLSGPVPAPTGDGEEKALGRGNESARNGALGRRDAGLRTMGVVASFGLVASAWYGVESRLVWGASVAYLAWALLRSPVSRPKTVRRSAGWELCAWCLAAAGGLFTLIVQRPSEDDPIYLNFAVAAVDSPGAPLLHFDTIHGLAGLPIYMPVFKLHSFEMLAAALSYLSPLSVIQITHWLLAAGAGVLTVLAWARLMRLLAPENWLAALTVVVALLFSVAETSSFYGDYAFIRVHQAKGIFVSALVPLLIVYGVRFAARPNFHRGLLLAAAQVASLGLTSTAMWVAPVVATLAVAARVSVNWGGIRVLLCGLVTSAYLVAAGLLLRAEQSAALGDFRIVASVEELLSRDVKEMLGVGPLAFGCLVSVLAAWCFARDGAARRLCVVFALGFLLFLFNPFVSMLFADMVTSPSHHYRVFWVLPIPAFLALAAIAPLGVTHRWATAPLRLAATGLLSVSFIVWAPTLYTVSPDNRTHLEFFGLKVPPAEYEVAKVLAARAPPRSWVLAPVLISQWIVSVHQHPYPLVPRKLYLEVMKQGFSPEERQTRWELTKWVSGHYRPFRPLRMLESAIRRFDLRAIGVTTGRYSEEITRFLAKQGFRREFSKPPYEVWLRDAGKGL